VIVEAQVTINGSRAAIWSAITDIEHASETISGIEDIEVVEKPADQVGFAVLPKRWVVERTFAWLGRYRQLSKEYDHYPESTESWIYLASIDILLKRLFRDT